MRIFCFQKTLLLDKLLPSVSVSVVALYYCTRHTCIKVKKYISTTSEYGLPFFLIATLCRQSSQVFFTAFLNQVNRHVACTCLADPEQWHGVMSGSSPSEWHIRQMFWDSCISLLSLSLISPCKSVAKCFCWRSFIMLYTRCCRCWRLAREDAATCKQSKLNSVFVLF